MLDRARYAEYSARYSLFQILIIILIIIFLSQFSRNRQIIIIIISKHKKKNEYLFCCRGRCGKADDSMMDTGKAHARVRMDIETRKSASTSDSACTFT